MADSMTVVQVVAEVLGAGLSAGFVVRRVMTARVGELLRLVVREEVKPLADRVEQLERESRAPCRRPLRPVSDCDAA